MAKSSRASSRKVNNQRLKKNVFGPAEIARSERLSAKLLELASQPKPEKPEGEEMKVVDDEESAAKEATAADANDDTMELDNAKSTSTSSKKAGKGRIQKRRKPSKIVFPKYGDKKNKKRKH
ncbi:hypothetical protein F4780DRAFT_723368 [Xylariomycetidae sp. FL0641]|nr:hypothetical protein F4780DRAFT_723368 [Xylariomycetidae sp. FL0641]